MPSLDGCSWPSFFSGALVLRMLVPNRCSRTCMARLAHQLRNGCTCLRHPSKAGVPKIVKP